MLIKFHEATHIVAQLYGVPHGILGVFIIAPELQSSEC
jgi:hypothetical protein